MELLGREAADVVSVACSSASSTSFATLSGRGALTLWDIRLKRKNYLSFANPNRAVREDASELLFRPDRHAAVAMCGSTIQLYDTRKSVSLVAEYQHAKECAAFFKGPVPSETTTTTTTLVVDEDGSIFPFSLLDGTTPGVLEPYVFGSLCTLPADAPTFGQLSNYCAGLLSVDVPSSTHEAATHSVRSLFCVGMDGHGALYSSSSSDDGSGGGNASSIRAQPFCIMDAPQTRKAGQMVNPPLVNCAAVHDAYVAVGRADGTYTVYEVTSEGVEAAVEAPGHAVNGLCYVDWLSTDVLITTSLCGEVSGWKVGPLLLPKEEGEEEEEEEEEELPEVVAALAHREVAGCRQATVNCGDRLSGSSYVFGDNMGGVTLARVELA